MRDWSGKVTDDADSWRARQADADQAKAQLVDTVRAAAAEGMSEYALARLVGVQRLTIRAWLGKGTPR